MDRLVQYANMMNEATGSRVKSVSAETALKRPWSEVMKRRKKIMKNLLVVTGTDESPVTEIKTELSRALEGIEISDTRFTNKGKIVMNFAEETLRDEAAQKITNVDKLSARPVKKLMTNITLCIVYKEECKESVKNTIIAKNEYLLAVPEIQTKIELLFSKPAASVTVQYVLKCDPKVRELMHQNDNKIKLQWGMYQVRDRYHAIISYHCQRYGHTGENCTAKKNGELPYCFKCADRRHRSKDCSSTENKCINCTRYKEMVGHSVNDHCFPVLESEIDRIRNITDHCY